MLGAVGGEEVPALRPVTRTVVFAGCSLLFVCCAIAGGVLLLSVARPADSGLDPDPLAVPAVEDSEPSPERPQNGAVGGQDQVLKEVDAAYQETKSELRSAYDESKEGLPLEIAEPLEQDLNLVESAIAEIGAALASDPDNESLKRMLVATYRNEMMLLKRALHLAGDEPEENDE